MSKMFYNCSSLTVLPDISKWSMKNVTDISKMFYNCSSLISLPDISKWDTKNVKKMKKMFFNCISLSSLKDLSKWNPNKDKIKVNKKFIDLPFLTPVPFLMKQKFEKFMVDNVTLFGNKASDFFDFDDNNISHIKTEEKNMDIRNMYDNCISLLYIPYLKEK